MSTLTEKQPFISVIVVAYNYAHFLPRALGALQRQSYKAIEIVIVNNGSTDNSQEIIDAFIQDNPDIRVVLVSISVNNGLAQGRNAGIEASTGEYIMFNDADDWMEDPCLDVLASLTKERGADKVFGAFKEINGKGKVIRVCSFCEDHSKWFAVSLQATLFKRSIVEEHQLRFHQTWLDDIDFNTFFNFHAKTVAFTNEPIYNYYVNQYSTSGAKVKKKAWTQLDLQKDMLELFVPLTEKVDGKDREDLHYILIKQYYFYMLHGNRYSTVKEMNEYYQKAHGMMLTYLPSYLKQKINPFRKNGDRATGRFLTWLFFVSEKFHFIKVLMWMFLCVSKITYVNP